MRSFVKFKSFFNFLKTRAYDLLKPFQFKNFLQRKNKNFCQKAPKHFKDSENCDLFSLGRDQLKNLIDKNIHFAFFQIEDFSVHYDELTQLLLVTAKKTTKAELLDDLKSQDSKQPMVLICDKGMISQQLAKQLRDKGFINVYFVKEGLKGLLKKEVSSESKK